MLKRFYIFSSIFFIILLLFFTYINYNIIIKKNNIIFNYPKWEINFAWEIIPMSWENYLNKQKFDKEFLITWNNLYQFYLYIKRYPLYIPYIEKELQKAWIPNDFKYLAIAESALRNNVTSSAWASWIWQFMPDTAKRFDLIINDYVDERYNFEKSTKAATKYIVFLYNEFWNWTLAASAYNRWEWWIKKALKKQNVNSYYDLYLNEETSRYIFKIVAVKYLIIEYFKKKNFIDSLIWWTYKKPNTKEINVKKIDNIIEFAKKYNTNYKTIKILNPWILWDSLPEWNWKIKILK